MKLTHYKDSRNRQPKFFRYFISYSYCSRYGSGFGNVEVTRRKQFKNMQDIKAWARDYEKEMGFNPNTLVVSNFQLF